MILKMDVQTAFIHGKLREEIYMSQPEGFVVKGKEDHAGLLKKSLYGHSPRPRQWYLLFYRFMVAHGFMRSPYESCVYHKKVPDQSYLYLLLYGDDMLIAAKEMAEVL